MNPSLHLTRPIVCSLSLFLFLGGISLAFFDTHVWCSRFASFSFKPPLLSAPTLQCIVAAVAAAAVAVAAATTLESKLSSANWFAYRVTFIRRFCVFLPSCGVVVRSPAFESILEHNAKPDNRSLATATASTPAATAAANTRQCHRLCSRCCVVVVVVVVADTAEKPRSHTTCSHDCDAGKFDSGTDTRRTGNRTSQSEDVVIADGTKKAAARLGGRVIRKPCDSTA